MQILDAGARIPAAAAKQAGYVGVLRYVAPFLNGKPNPKCITAAELADDVACGLLVGIVFEQGAQNSLGGAPQGHVDGRVARDAVRALGIPDGAGIIIYAAVDFYADSSTWPSIAAYLDGFRSEVHAAGQRQGGYGKYGLGLQMLKDGHAEGWWESGAWSGTQRLQGTPGADLFQRIGSVTVGGVTCDVNDVWATDWGQWPRPEGDDMFTDQDRALLQGIKEWIDKMENGVPIDGVEPLPTSTSFTHRNTKKIAEKLGITDAE